MATVKNIRWAMSGVESPYNEILDDPSAYRGLVSQNPEPMIPSQEKETDFNVFGRGQEFPTAQLGTYWIRPRFTFSDRINASMALMHVRHALGGTDVVTGAGADKTHTIPMIKASDGIQLPAYNIACWLRAGDFLYMGNVADRFSISQQGAQIPVYSVEYVGSGKWRRLQEITTVNGYGDDFDVATVPDPADFDDMAYLFGANVAVSLNDGTSYDITGAGILRNFNLTLNNNHIVDDRRVGDPFNFEGASGTDLTANGYANVYDTGFVQDHCEYGERSVQCSMQVVMDDADLREWDAMRKDTKITALKYTVTGKKIGATSTLYTFEINVPVAYVASATAGTDGDRPVVNMEFTAMLDPVTEGLLYVVGKNDSATVID